MRKQSLKEVFKLNPISILWITILLTTFIIHFAEYWLNYILNKDASFGVYNYSIPFPVTIVLFIILLVVFVKIRGRMDGVPTDKELLERSFWNSKLVSIVWILLTSLCTTYVLYYEIHYISERSLNYGIYSLREIIPLEIFLFSFWAFALLLVFFADNQLGNVILSAISVGLVIVMVFYLLIVNVERGSGVSSIQGFIQDQILQSIYDDAGIGKVMGWMSVIDHPEVVVHQFLGYLAGVFLVLHGLLAQFRFMNHVAVWIASIAGVIGVLLFALSFTPVLDILAALLSAV